MTVRPLVAVGAVMVLTACASTTAAPTPSTRPLLRFVLRAVAHSESVGSAGQAARRKPQPDRSPANPSVPEDAAYQWLKRPSYTH